MNDPQFQTMFNQLVDGRTELVFELLAAGCPATYKDHDGVSLMRHCAYFGDVSAMKYLLAHGGPIDSLGDNLGLDAAAFHGHWRLCKFLLEQGADVNYRLADTGETPLHSALCKTDHVIYDRVLKVLLSFGADPNVVTNDAVETGGFMRDCRTKGETPLHRAAAFGGVETVQVLIDAGARLDTRDMNGDTPLSWASWYLRPASILRLLCYGDFRVHSQCQEMRANLLGRPHA
jgi:ankyrin repeat protein